MEIHNEAHACPRCGQAMVRRTHEHVEYVGKLKVVDKTAIQCVCDACHTVEMPFEALRGYELRAAWVALHDGKDRATGSALRYARKAVGLTQKQLGAILGYEPTHLSRLETAAEEPLSNVQRLSMLSVVQAALDGVSVEQMVETVEGPAPQSLEVPPNAPKLRQTG